MPKVKALRAHDNSYGDSFRKAEGDVYVHPAPQSLIDNKLVEIVDEGDGEGRRAPRTGKRSSGAAEGDAAEHTE